MKSFHISLFLNNNPRVPGIINDELPVFEPVTSSQYVADHLETLNAARKTYIRAEACFKIKRALSKNVRPDEGPLFNGEELFYNREDKWRGQATVIGQDRKQVFLRHGGQVVRVHPCKLKRRRDCTEPMPLPEEPCPIAQGYTDQLSTECSAAMKTMLKDVKTKIQASFLRPTSEQTKTLLK